VEKLGHLLGPTFSTTQEAPGHRYEYRCDGGRGAPGDLKIVGWPFQGGRGGFKLELSFVSLVQRG
jgi:hypothetical protein